MRFKKLRGAYKARVMNESLKMQALEKKLRCGFTLEDSCRQIGIEIEAAKGFLEAKKELDDFNRIADGMWGRSAAVKAVDKLKKIIAACEDDEVCRRASKDLLDFYRDERKRLEQKVAEAGKLAAEQGQNDLWDSWENPWAFTSEDS